MHQKITNEIKELLEVTDKETENLSVEEAINFINDDNCSIIDVRDYIEIKREGKITAFFSSPRRVLEFLIDTICLCQKIIFKKALNW